MLLLIVVVLYRDSSKEWLCLKKFNTHPITKTKVWERPQTSHETVRNSLPGEMNTSFLFVQLFSFIVQWPHYAYIFSGCLAELGGANHKLYKVNP